jgi:glycosyltransferase involved in cell wall biosynthesis
MIAHNEERNIALALESVRWANEIIVVDCESQDATVAIVKKFTEKIFYRPNLQNLNVNKNFSFTQATSEWILCLDADEIIRDELRKEIEHTIQEGKSIKGYFMKRKNYYFGNWLKYGGQFPDMQLRLFRKNFGKFPEKHVHERIEIDGKIGELHTAFEHYPYNTISDCILKMDFYTSFEAQKYFDDNLSTDFFSIIRRMALRPVRRFFSRYILKRGFLDGMSGFLACFMDCIAQVISFGKYYYLKNKR